MYVYIVYSVYTARCNSNRQNRNRQNNKINPTNHGKQQTSSPSPLLTISPSQAFPAELDSRFLLGRLYGDDSINGGRSLDHNLVMRVVVRNSGIQADGTTDATTNLALAQVHFAKFPSPAALYDSVWGLIPDFLRAKIARWAADDKQGDIAEAITEFVKTALGLLPIPVPSFFLNGAVNLVVPPLVQLIMTKLAASAEARRALLPCRRSDLHHL